MSDLSQSQTASLVLNPGDTYRISTGGTATVKAIYGAPAGTTTITANFATFGPYDAPAKLDVTALSGTASYSLLAAIPVTKVDGKYSDPALQALVSGAGNFALASGGAVNRTLKRMTDTIGVGAANSGTAATVTLEANSPWGTGVPAYKIVLVAGNTYHEVTLTSLGIAAFNGHVVWSAWIEDYTTIQQVQLFAGTTGYGRLYQRTYNINNSTMHRYSGEHRMVVGPTTTNSTGTFLPGADTLAETKLRLFKNTDGAVLWVREVVLPGVGRPTHLLTYDDASVTWITNVLPHLAESGLKGSFAINTAQIGTNANLYIDYPQVATIAAAGHQVSPHNVNNYPVDDGITTDPEKITTAAYATEFRTAITALGGAAGQLLDTSYHAWVKGSNNQAAHDALRPAGLRLARGTDPGHNFPQIGLGQQTMSLKNVPLHTLTTAAIDLWCDQAIAYGTTNLWMIHEVPTVGGSDGGGDVETNATVHRYLCQRIARDVAAGRAVNRTTAQFGREIYAERLVPTALLG